MTTSRLTHPVILVADDDHALHSSLHLMLDDDYDVLDAYDGNETLAICQSRHIDLLLLDILMPGADGIAVLEQLRAANLTLPVILVTGLHSAWPAVTGLQLGALESSVDTQNRPVVDT
jgi:two-component system cell cycle response regulator